VAELLIQEKKRCQINTKKSKKLLFTKQTVSSIMKIDSLPVYGRQKNNKGDLTYEENQSGCSVPGSGPVCDFRSD
jgi:hypothetical protein